MGSGNSKASSVRSVVKYTKKQKTDFGTIMKMGDSFTVIKYTILLHFSIFRMASAYNAFDLASLDSKRTNFNGFRC